MLPLFIFIFLTGRTTQTGLGLSIKRNIHNTLFPEMKGKNTHTWASYHNKWSYVPRWWGGIIKVGNNKEIWTPFFHSSWSCSSVSEPSGTQQHLRNIPPPREFSLVWNIQIEYIYTKSSRVWVPDIPAKSFTYFTYWSDSQVSSV